MILVECYADKTLILNIGFSKKIIKHEGGRGNVINKLRSIDNGIGIIDEDPNSPRPSDMDNYFEIDRRDSIRLLARKDDERKRIIQISQFLEDWFIRRARENNISLRNFNLPDDSYELHKIPRLDKYRNFQNFLNELIEVDNEVDTIKDWINEIV